MQAQQRADVTLDLIRNTAPFSMDFYRQLARGYVRSGRRACTRCCAGRNTEVLSEDDGSTEPFDRVGRHRDDSRRGDARGAAVDRRALSSHPSSHGTARSSGTPGWINILITTDPGERVTCGQSYIGRDPGEINLIINPVCSCGCDQNPRARRRARGRSRTGILPCVGFEERHVSARPGNCPLGEIERRRTLSRGHRLSTAARQCRTRQRSRRAVRRFGPETVRPFS